MNEDLKFAIDLLIAEGHWAALNTISDAFGGEVYDYINNHEDCPWYNG